jgi:adenylate kinase family enzyme
VALAARIHVFGASGSGTTTLGRALATRLGCPHFDADDYYWVSTDPPFRTKRPPEERMELLRKDLRPPAWVLSGSMVIWGDPLIHLFTAAVFVYTSATVRFQRLLERERTRYGERIEPGGDMHRQHGEFMQWASSYDEPRTDLRSKRVHEAWIEKLACKVLRVDGARPVEQLVDVVMGRVE